MLNLALESASEAELEGALGRLVLETGSDEHAVLIGLVGRVAAVPRQVVDSGLSGVVVEEDPLEFLSAKIYMM